VASKNENNPRATRVLACLFATALLGPLVGCNTQRAQQQTPQARWAQYIRLGTWLGPDTCGYPAGFDSRRRHVGCRKPRPYCDFRGYNQIS
jgi:hypothetical protein